MKLRNKRTGEIVETDYMFGVSVPTNNTFGYRSYDQIASYGSLAELNEEWEDYKPAEPLIKDEKIRRAVRAWAEVNGSFEGIKICTLTAGTRFSIGHYVIEFMGYFIYDLESNKTYTIAELCGEDEE